MYVKQDVGSLMGMVYCEDVEMLDVFACLNYFVLMPGSVLSGAESSKV
jgi:hypothetical protein